MKNTTFYIYLMLLIIAGSNTCKSSELFAPLGGFIFNGDTFRVNSDLKNTVKEKPKEITDKIEPKPDSIKLEFVGSSELQKAISNHSDLPANAGIGVFFTKNYGTPTRLLKIDKLELELKITIASTIDTINATMKNNNVENIRDFGNSILLPYSSKQSASVNFRTFISTKQDKSKLLPHNFGIEGSLIASNRMWKIMDKANNVSTLSVNLGVFSELLPKKNMENFSLSLGIDLTTRWIFGDIGQQKNDTFRKDIIGTDKRCFLGFEPNITIRLKNIKATASIPFLFSHEGVSGLTKGQFITLIGFTGGFPIGLK